MSTCTRPSTKCASVKGAWFTISSTAPCTAPWAMCAPTINWRRRLPRPSSGLPASKPVNSGPRAKCAWPPMRCWNSLRLSRRSIRRRVRELARVISINTRRVRSPVHLSPKRRPPIASFLRRCPRPMPSRSRPGRTTSRRWVMRWHNSRASTFFRKTLRAWCWWTCTPPTSGSCMSV
ncbi:hypothetical protein D3C86_1450740 [compost metagenome]